MKHPRTPFFEQLTRLGGSAAAQGYRMPAEWEPLACVWVSPPHNPDTWPGCLAQARRQFDDFVAELRTAVAVAATQDLGVQTVDSWIRDYGPLFVVRGRPGGTAPQGEAVRAAPAGSGLALHDFRFNTWGGKYDARPADDVVPQYVARRLGLPLWVHDMVLEGGSIDVNGRGALLTTEQCLLNPNRNPGLARADIERALADALGAGHVLWLPGGIVGDDTDGHVDDLARFVNATTVAAVRAPPGHPDHAMLERNWGVLQQARDQDGQRLTLVDLPAPDPVFYDFPPGRYYPPGRREVPASYANFLIANGTVLVPVFGQRTDDAALRVLEQALPRRRVVGLRAEHLVVGLGAFHCLTQQQPAVG